MVEFFFAGLVKFPIDYGQVSGKPDTNFARNALIKFKVNPAPEPLRGMSFWYCTVIGRRCM